MEALSLRYKVRFDLSVATPVIKVSDLIQSDYNSIYGYTMNNIKGLIKVISPVGIIYANAGFATDNFTSPDTKGAATAVWEKSVNLPLDTNGDVVKGAYTIQYKLSVDGTTKFIEDTLNYDFQFVTPTAVITPTVDRLKSRMTVVDNTVYTVGGVSPVNDLASDRLHTVVFPITSGQANQTSADETFAVAGNLWTGMFQVKLETPATYVMQYWSDDSAAVDVVTEIVGQTSIEAKDDDCACLYYNCIYSIEEKYVTAKINGNLREADRLSSVRNDIDLYHNMAALALTCGYDQSVWCEKIRTLARSENCMCPEDSSDTYSTEILPVSSSIDGGGGSTNQWTSSASDPLNEAGNDNDFHVNETSQKVFKKISGAWTHIFTIKGDKGDEGEGTWNIIHSFIGDAQSSGTTEVDLTSYTLDNTPTPILASAGDMLRIYSTFKLAHNDNGKRMKLYFGSTAIAEYFTDSDVDSLNDKVVMEAEVIRRASTVVAVRTTIMRGGSPATMKKVDMVTSLAQGLTSDFSIKTAAQNSVSSTGDVSCNELLVEYIKYQETIQTEEEPTSGPYMRHQLFIATALQTEFVVTDFNLNDDYAVFVSGALQTTSQTRSGNTVIFATGLAEGTEVVIYN